MKKYTAGFFAFVCSLVMIICGSTYAADYVPYIAMQLDNPDFSINGNVVPIDDMNTAPVLKDGSAMLPITALIGAINQLTEWNLSVLWDAGERKVTLMSDRPVAQLWIDRTTAVIDGAKIEVKAAPMIINGRAMVPVRVISESLGLYVQWYGDTRAILISFSPSGYPTQIVFPFDDTQPIIPVEESYVDGFRPVRSREEVYGIWDLSDKYDSNFDILYDREEIRSNIRFEEKYLIYLYSISIANERHYAPTYNLENGRLRYSYASISGLAGRNFLEYEDYLLDTTPENARFDYNNFRDYESDWRIEITEDGNTLRLSREAARSSISNSGEYRVKTQTYERRVDP